MMRNNGCPNLNHSRSNLSVRHCPTCGDVVNENVPAKKCSEEQHAIKRLDQNRFCADCGEQLIHGW